MVSRPLSTTYLFVVSAMCMAVPMACQSRDPVDMVVSSFGVPRERVIAVADELGVEPTGIETFGDCPFPCNYYKRQFEIFEQEQGRPPRRSEVEQLVRGYTAKCEPAYSKTTLQYVYYADPVNPGWEGTAIEIFFPLPPPDGPATKDPEVLALQIVNLRERSVNPLSSTYWNECIQEYLDSQ